MKVKLFFRWYDLWVGAYVDTANRTLYVCPLPMLGVRIQYGEPLSKPAAAVTLEALADLYGEQGFKVWRNRRGQYGARPLVSSHGGFPLVDCNRTATSALAHLVRASMGSEASVEVERRDTTLRGRSERLEDVATAAADLCRYYSDTGESTLGVHQQLICALARLETEQIPKVEDQPATR